MFLVFAVQLVFLFSGIWRGLPADLYFPVSQMQVLITIGLAAIFFKDLPDKMKII